MARALEVIAVLVAALSLTGCAADRSADSDVRSSESRSGQADMGGSGETTIFTDPEKGAVERCIVNDKIAFCGIVNDTVEINDCGSDGLFSLQGSGNTVTVNSTCKSVGVTGGNNKVYLQTVTDLIEVAGGGNTITYRDGDPEIRNLSKDASTSITKG